MKIIILGAGKVGQELCAELSRSHDVIMIDQKDTMIDHLMTKFDVTGVVGNGTVVEVLQEAGIGDTDIFVAATESDEVNIIASSLAKEIGVNYTVARVRNPEYIKQLDFMKRALGISLIINPELAAARDISRTLRYASALSVQTLAGNRVSLVEIEVKPKSVIENMSLSDFRTQYGSVLVCIINRDNHVFIPSGQDDLRAEDKIFIAGLPKDMATFQRKIGNKEKAIKSLFIVGGGKIAQYLLQLLEHLHLNIKVIDYNLERCEQLSSDYPQVRVIHADGTDTEVLEEQGLNQYDAFVSLTGIDEENLITSIYANNVGVRKVITKMSRTNILKIIDTSSLKQIVTPKNLIANEIAKFVKSRANAKDSNIEALYRVANNTVEVLQFKIEKMCELLNTPLSQLSLKKDLLIAYIIRKGNIVFPTGQDVLLLDDSVIVITTSRDLGDIKDILK